MRKPAVALVLTLFLPACGSDPVVGPPDPPPVTQPPVTQPPVTERDVTVSSTDVPKDIPNMTTTTSFIDVAATGMVLDLATSMVISHTWRGDLELRLRHPDGTTATFFTPSGGDSRDDVVETFSVATASNLGQLLNKPSQGRWTLMVIDAQPRDNGRLISWSMRLRVRG